MKASKRILPIVLIGILCLSWVSFFSKTANANAEYDACLREAENSINGGLYEQAIEYYKKSLEYKYTEGTYETIKGLYDKLYEEEHTAFVRTLYMEDMALASLEFPKNSLFWEAQIKLHMEAQNYSKAYTTVKKARNYGATSEHLEELYKELLYMVSVDYKQYSGFKMALNGYLTVFDRNVWKVLDETGNALTSQYTFIGLINDNGKGLYVNDLGTRILDINGVTRARFDIVVEDAGYYNEKSDLLPVKVNGVWRYIDSKGDFVGNEYVVAGSFYNNMAVAYTGEKWVLIDSKGMETELIGIEDVKLDLYGCHNQNGLIIAKKAGKYYFFDENFNQNGEFSADDMDICIDGKTVAFKKGDKWGFVKLTGEILVEPQYTAAKSYANGYAAVCNEAGLWGFINEKSELVIDYQYLDAHYFTKSETCMVSITEGSFQKIRFMFE